MNLLSVGAALGVLSLAFDTVDTLTPPLVLAIVFGLSMDYEVFLLSRIRERYEATGDTRRAVAEGLAASARTITSAALIMVAVFGVFIAVGVPSIQQIGLGTAVAIALDATLVRLDPRPGDDGAARQVELVPAAAARAAILPRADFEAVPAARGGSRLAEHLPRRPERAHGPARAQPPGGDRAARVQPAREDVDEVVVADPVGHVGVGREARPRRRAAVVHAAGARARRRGSPTAA